MRRTRPQHPRSSVPGRRRPSDPRADGGVPRPRGHFSTARGTRLRPASRASPLTCGSGRRAEVPSASPGRPEAAASLSPPHLRRSPAAASGIRSARAPRPGTRVLPRWAPDVQPAASGRAPSCAQVAAARADPGGGPSQPPNPGPQQARARVDLPAPPPPPHLPPPEPQPPRLLPGSAPPPPPAPAAAGRKGREEMPGSASASCGAVPPLSGRGGPPISTAAPAAPERQNLVGEAVATTVPMATAAFCVWERLAKSAKEGRGCPRA